MLLYVTKDLLYKFWSPDKRRCPKCFLGYGCSGNRTQLELGRRYYALDVEALVTECGSNMGIVVVVERMLWSWKFLVVLGWMLW